MRVQSGPNWAAFTPATGDKNRAGAEPVQEGRLGGGATRLAESARPGLFFLFLFSQSCTRLKTRPVEREESVLTREPPEVISAHDCGVGVAAEAGRCVLFVPVRENRTERITNTVAA